MNVGVIEGGDACNQIPGRATADIDIRFTATSGIETIESLLKQVNDRHPSLSISTIDYYDATTHDLSHPYFELYSSLVTQIVGITPRAIVSHGGSDAKYLAENGIPCLVSKPIGGPQHADDEWIDIESLHQFYEVLKLFVMETTHKPHAD
jgi:acetylornithine deacetylase/succinyl-diaminopimelate desuccinylase-like protein